jgi:RNA polymerase subunit RPABC4/transcription elongation factor Spt4
VDPNEHFSDETCIHCGNRLKPGTTVCPHCHANLQDTAYTSRICRSCQTETNEAKCPQCGSDTDAKQAEAPSPTVVNEVYAPRVAINWMKIAVLAIIILAIAGLVYIFWPRQFNATLTNTRWETTQNIQEHQYNQYSGWDYPSNAINVSSVPKIHHYVNVETGEQEVCEDVPDCDTVQVYDYTVQEVNDDGTYTEYDVTRDETTCNTVEVCEMVTFYREDPVYQDWYTYYVWEWVNIEPCTQTGNSLPITYPDTTNLPENQRLDGDPTCTSTVYFETEDGDEKHKGVDCSDLASGDYPIGSQWILHTNGPIVSDLERK